MADGYEIHTTPALLDMRDYYREEVRIARGQSYCRAQAHLEAIQAVLTERGF